MPQTSKGCFTNASCIGTAAEVTPVRRIGASRSAFGRDQQTVLNDAMALQAGGKKAAARLVGKSAPELVTLLLSPT